MSGEEFAWRTAVLVVVNGMVMWLAIKLFDFGNARNRLVAAILWSIPVSALLHAGFWIEAVNPFSLWVARIFHIAAMVIFYGALFKWYDLSAGQMLGVSVATVGVDVAAYAVLTELGVLPPFWTAAIAFTLSFV